MFERSGQVADDVAYAANLAPGECAVLGRNEYDVLAIDAGRSCLARVMQVLSQHVGRYEGDAGVGDPETAGAIGFGILANDRAGFDLGAAVDDGLVDPAVLADVDFGQDD